MTFHHLMIPRSRWKHLFFVATTRLDMLRLFITNISFCRWNSSWGLVKNTLFCRGDAAGNVPTFSKIYLSFVARNTAGNCLKVLFLKAPGVHVLRCLSSSKISLFCQHNSAGNRTRSANNYLLVAHSQMFKRLTSSPSAQPPDIKSGHQHTIRTLYDADCSNVWGWFRSRMLHLHGVRLR